MSTYFYLICDDHGQYCHAAASSGDNHLIDSEETLCPFIACHGWCHTRIASDAGHLDLSGLLLWTPETARAWRAGDFEGNIPTASDFDRPRDGWRSLKRSLRLVDVPASDLRGGP
jgi:hypothetical protein